MLRTNRLLAGTMIIAVAGFASGCDQSKHPFEPGVVFVPCGVVIPASSAIAPPPVVESCVKKP